MEWNRLSNFDKRPCVEQSVTFGGNWISSLSEDVFKKLFKTDDTQRKMDIG